MNIKERVQSRLKPKVKQFGFTRKVFKSVAAKIAGKLDDIDENASEDDINAKVDEAIEDSLPYLDLIQSQANELHSEWKKGLQKDGDEDEDDEASNDDDDSSVHRNRPVKSSRASKKDEEPAWFKKFREEQEAKFEALKGEKIADTRRSKMEKLLKDTGSFGKAAMRSFAKAKFDNDDDFEDFYSGVEDDLKAYNQERADAGLSKAGNPPGGKTDGKQESKMEEVTDAEIDAIVANL